MKNIVILGGGTAGTMMASRLSQALGSELKAGEVGITVVDEDHDHIYQPGLVFVPFGIYDPADLVRPKRRYYPDRVKSIVGRIEAVDADQNQVTLGNGQTLPYDILIIATGTRIVPVETEGLTGPGWYERAFDFYTLEGATALHEALEQWDGGKLVINIVDMPIKCPVAPLEFAFLADWYFTKRGIRDKVEIAYVTPLDGAFTRPLASERFGGLLKEKNVRLVTEFATGEVDGAAGRLISWDEREEPFDLLVTVPVHMGAEFLSRTPGLADAMGFVEMDPGTLQSKLRGNIFAIGDATNLPTSKAGSVAHFEAGILTDNVLAALKGQEPTKQFDGHANCFVETGFGKALLIDFNYDVEPLPGKFPSQTFGPLPLLKESRLNHYGKMFFKWIYWNVLLRGREIPGVEGDLKTNGRRRSKRSAEHIETAA